MDTTVLDWRAITESRAGRVPVGYLLPNGTTVVWNGANQNNIATLEQAQRMFPTLRLLPTD
jgi:hypothetical protein